MVKKLLHHRLLPLLLMLLCLLGMAKVLHDRVQPIRVQDVGYCEFVHYEVGEDADTITVQFNNLEAEWPSDQPVTLRITDKKARELFADFYLPQIEGIWIRATISHSELWELGYYPATSELISTLLSNESPEVWNRYLTAVGVRGG